MSEQQALNPDQKLETQLVFYFTTSRINTICRSHRKLAPFIPGVENVEAIKPWSPSPLQIVINDHLPPKQTTDTSVLYNLTMATMSDITQPQDHLYFTDGSVSEGRVSAAFTYLGQPTLIRLCDNASIMQAELTAIHAALLHGLPSRCDIFSDSRSGLEALIQHQPTDNIKLLRDIWDLAARMTTPPLIARIPSHIGIAGNEATDRAASRALMKPNIDTSPTYPLAKHEPDDLSNKPLETFMRH